MAKSSRREKFDPTECDFGHKMPFMDKFIKIIAGEDLTVIRGRFETASCDVENRVIFMPNFGFSDEDVAVLMAAHEVSHALHTPPDWHHLATNGNEETNKVSRELKYCINVVEDIRIEKLIRSKYLGFISKFRAGYKYLLDNKFFGKLDRKLTFLDIVNVYSKVGDLSKVRPITSRDYAAYKYIASAKTFEDVLVRAKFMLEYSKRFKPVNFEDPSEVKQRESEESGDQGNTDFTEMMESMTDGDDITGELLEEIEKALKDFINGTNPELSDRDASECGSMSHYESKLRSTVAYGDTECSVSKVDKINRATIPGLF